MKYLFFFFIIGIITFGLTACNSTKKQEKSSVPKADNSMNSLDWNGTYQGILPCADCPGIKTQLVLTSDLTYVLKMKYMERSVAIIETQGKFSWNSDGNKITLDGNGHQMYLVGENRLFSLDGEGNKITGDLADRFIFKKEKTELTGKNWKLARLNGKIIENAPKQPFILFDKEDYRISGNTGCNNFFGTYELIDQNGIKFSKIGMTKMACIGNNPEQEYIDVLAKVTNYSLAVNELILKDKNGKALAKFEEDYFSE